MTMNEELWRVQLATGEVRVMTLDALDQAFDAGIIHGGTQVLAPGATSWARLGDVAGLDDAAPESAVTPSLSPVAIATDTPSAFAAAPVPVDLGEIPDDALRPKRGRGLILGGIGMAAVAGLAIAFALPKLGAMLGNVHPAKDMANAMQAPPPPAVDVTPDDGSFKRPALTEEQKRLLAEADKKKEEEREKKAKQAVPARGGKGAPRTKSSSPFVNGGDKFDPLNGAL